MERVSAQTAGMVNIAPWRAAPVTAAVTAPARCPTTSSAGSVCARAAGTGLAVTSGSSRTATTGWTTTRVSRGGWSWWHHWWCHYRWAGGLWRPWVLWGSCLWTLPALPHRVRPHRHPAQEAAARRHRLLLREDEVHHRGSRPPELRQEEGVQRKVGPARLGLTVSWCDSLCLAVSVPGGKILIRVNTTSCLRKVMVMWSALPCTNNEIIKAQY